MSKRITYLLGAGSSYQACPIWKEQGEKMCELAKYFLPTATFQLSEKESYQKDIEKMFWNIGMLGTKANEFGTIDTYAKKYYLNDSRYELEDLKTAVSLFFTIWQSLDDKKIKQVSNLDPGKSVDRFKTIDQRYISLLSTCLEKKSGQYRPVLNENIHFITWNYDLQLEYAYKLFCDNMEWGDVNKHFSYIPSESDPDSKLNVCHLNGFHGFYKTEKSFHNIIDLIDHKDKDSIISELDFIPTSVKRGKLSFAPYINYAWENDSPLSKIARDHAIKTFSETDILVIIGYSFPSFNREIDKMLFVSGKSQIKKIIYQDPKASKDYLSEAFNIERNKIETVNDSPDHFILPSLF